MRFPFLRLGAASLVCSALVASSSRAQDEPPPPPDQPPPGVEEFVVLAGESEAAADFEAGDSIATFGAEDLAALGAQSVADLANFTPNLEIVTTGSTTPTFFIRGVGLNDFNANSTGAVAIYQDDVPLNAPALQLPLLFDITDINILRGPQGTGQARNASAGAIKTYSRKPSGQYGGYIQTEFGNFDYVDVEGAVEAPIYEDLIQARVAFKFRERDGFARNQCGGAPPRSGRAPRRRGDSDVEPFATDPSRPEELGLPISFCGESIQRARSPILDLPNPPPIANLPDGFSDLPPGLPSAVNNTDVWAARAMLFFQPTLDSEWLLIGRVSMREEQARLGQSLGTNLTVLDDECVADLQAMLGRPPRIGELNEAGCNVTRSLGGADGGGFRPDEVRRREIELNPCIALADPDSPRGPTVPTGACDVGTPQENAFENLVQGSDARKALAEELSDLDSDPYLGQWNRVGPLDLDIWGISLKGETVFADSLVLTNVTAFDTYDRLSDVDLDNSPNPLFEIETDDEGWQFVQTLNLRSEATDEFPVTWDVGAFYLTEELDVVIANTFPPDTGQVSGVSDRDYVQTLHSLAGYVSASFDFWDDFTLDGGLRYNWERKEIDFRLVIAGRGERVQLEERTWQAPTGTLRLTYRFREDTHAFWKYTRGWKPGTFNATSSVRQGVLPAEPETIDAYEAGIKGSWFGGKLSGSFSVFHYNYENYQIFISQDIFQAQPEFVILNANDAEVNGAEVTLRARPFPTTTLQVNASWLDSQFLDFLQRQQTTLNDPSGGPLSIFVVDVPTQNAGNPLLNSPRFKVALTAEQTIPLGRFGRFVVRWDGAWSDDVAYDATGGFGLPDPQGNRFLPENTIGQEAYWQHNLRFAYQTPDGSVEIAAWARNLGDVAYKQFAFDAASFNQTTVYFVSDPRTYGGSVRITF